MKYIHHLFAKLFYKVRSDSEQDLSEDIMVLSENAGWEKMEAMAPNLQESEEGKPHASFQVARENRHQEIWSVLEGVWNAINLYRYGMLKKLRASAEPCIISTQAHFRNCGSCFQRGSY